MTWSFGNLTQLTNISTMTVLLPPKKHKGQRLLLEPVSNEVHPWGNDIAYQSSLPISERSSFR